MSIAENVEIIRAQLNQAAIAVGRDPKQILLCAATKMNDAQAVKAAIAAGVDLCGENRVQELTQKLSQNAYTGAPVHFIGHLQTNKVKQVVGKVDLIQSVDSLRLLTAINEEAARQGIRQDILLEVNIGMEVSKSGFLHRKSCLWQMKCPAFPTFVSGGSWPFPPFVKFPQKIVNFLKKCISFMLTQRQKTAIIYPWIYCPWACPMTLLRPSPVAVP